ncbi:hypothetical protein [Antrihabitans stalactiti]|uniref:Uncharacterized protein n=1 Tax=Antrihabitans stalactiti TaxID=2584121 RepID=A0A848KGA9_9NOCA|nr:hypothetical protein [Antrihabitans stalactiti]NMN96806.1 hypothetical protein [Antrihabitans stalactiti]
MHPILTSIEIDSDLSARNAELERIIASLVELDQHPGLAHLRLYPPTGNTAKKWAPCAASLALMWDDYGRMKSILESARTVRARRSKPNDADRVELTHLLRDRPLELERTAVPLAQRSLMGPTETVLHIGIADIVERMKVAYPAVTELVSAVDEINSFVLSQLAPLQKRLDKIAAALSVDPDGSTAPSELRAVSRDIANLLDTSANDPLSLTVPSVEAAITTIADRVGRVCSEFDGIAKVLAHWASTIAELGSEVNEIAESRLRGAQARDKVARSIVTAPLPIPSDRTESLRSRLTEVAALRGNPKARVAAIKSLREAVETELTQAAADEDLAQGLLDRHAELRGRHSAYQAKAARLGVGEDRDVLAADRTAADLLARRPCDLQAATRAITAQRDIIAAKATAREENR